MSSSPERQCNVETASYSFLSDSLHHIKRKRGGIVCTSTTSSILAFSADRLCSRECGVCKSRRVCLSWTCWHLVLPERLNHCRLSLNQKFIPCVFRGGPIFGSKPSALCPLIKKSYYWPVHDMAFSISPLWSVHLRTKPNPKAALY